MMLPVARRAALVAFAAAALLTISGGAAAAADQWIEVRSPHFTLTSNAGKGDTLRLAWQLEQVRSEIAVLWPWAKVDLNRPLSVFILKDEQSMKLLAPAFWEKKNDVRAASVWASGYERTFLALRTDVEHDDRQHVNPYATSYFAYISLILQQSVPRRLPPWFARGLAGVMSNTVIEDARILVGAPVPWYLRRLHEGRRIVLPDLLAARDASPLLRGDDLGLFDAQAWALVHYLMFADQGARWKDLDRFASLAAGGMDPAVAFKEAIGRVEDLLTPLAAYVDRSLYSARIVDIDASVKREAFATTSLPPAVAAARRALFHVTMRRPAEARAMIDEARKAGGAPDAEVADALLLDAADQPDAARDAYQRAVDAGTTDAYAHYRLATLLWTRDAGHDLLTRIRTLLAKATSLNFRYAAAYDFLASVDSQLGNTDPGLALRAVSLEPGDPHHHLTAARVLAAAHRYDEALKQVDTAAELAESNASAREAADLKAWIQRQRQ